MTVTAYLWFEIVKSILILLVLLVGLVWVVLSVIAENERRKAYKGLKKGFHVQFTNIDSEKTVQEVAQAITEQLKDLEESR